MTEKELAEGFSAFMPGDYGARLASALCAERKPVTVVDDEQDAVPEDGSAFAEDGTFLPGTARTEAEQHVMEYYAGEDLMLAMPGCALFHGWAMGMLEASGAWAGLRYAPKPVREIALAVCAVTKAFPDRAADVIREHIARGALYGLFWDEAEGPCRPLLPDGMESD